MKASWRSLICSLRNKVPVTILAIGPLSGHRLPGAEFSGKYFIISKRWYSWGGRAPNQVLKYPFSDVVFTDFNIAQDLACYSDNFGGVGYSGHFHHLFIVFKRFIHEGADRFAPVARVQ